MRSPRSLADARERMAIRYAYTVSSPGPRRPMRRLALLQLAAGLLAPTNPLASTNDHGSVGCYCPACFAACKGACSKALRSACPPKDSNGNATVDPRARCEACVAAHAAVLAAASCGRIEEKSFCAQLPPALPTLRFTCEDGRCVEFVGGSFTDVGSCNSSCTLRPAEPPYDPTLLQWPWYVVSSSRRLSYTSPTRPAPRVGAEDRGWRASAPTPRWHSPSWPPPLAARYNVSLALQRGECEAVQLVVHAAMSDLLDITVDFGQAAVEGAGWQAMQQLFVQTVLPNTTAPGVYPDPLLPLAQNDPIPLVRAGETQPIVLRLCASTGIEPGKRSGLMIVLRGRVRGSLQPFQVSVPTVVEVWSLVLPPLGPERSLSLSADFMDRPVLQPGLYPAAAASAAAAPAPYGGATRKVWYSFLANYSIPANGNGDSGAILSLQEYKQQAAAGARWISVTDVSRLNCSSFPCVGNPVKKRHFCAIYIYNASFTKAGSGQT